jgi:DNA polymerase III epsilon subunit-like protein
MTESAMEKRLVFFDLETGGPDPKRNPIIQIAAIAIGEDLEPLEAFEVKVKFDSRKANLHSLRKNSYSAGHWARHAKEAKNAARDFAAFLTRHATVPCLSAKGDEYNVAQLVCHNAAFDGPFLTNWFEKLNLFLPAKRLVLCTLQLSMWHFFSAGQPLPSNFQLATLCQYFGIPFHAANAHDALGDVSATVQLYQALACNRPTAAVAA